MIWVQPRISEKSYTLVSTKNTYMFDVPLNANKLQIKEAISKQYNVTVIGVRTSIAKGKVKATPLRRRMPIPGRRSDAKRAYVTLKAGDNIPVFEEV